MILIKQSKCSLGFIFPRKSHSSSQSLYRKRSLVRNKINKNKDRQAMLRIRGGSTEGQEERLALMLIKGLPELDGIFTIIKTVLMTRFSVPSMFCLL